MRIVFTSARFDWRASAINICLLLLTFVLNKSLLMVHTTGHDAFSNDLPAMNVSLVWVLWFPQQRHKGFWSSGMRCCVAGSVAHGDVSKVVWRLYCLGFKVHKDWPSNICNYIAIWLSILNTATKFSHTALKIYENRKHEHSHAHGAGPHSMMPLYANSKQLHSWTLTVIVSCIVI